MYCGLCSFTYFWKEFAKILKIPLDNDDTYGIIKAQAKENIMANIIKDVDCKHCVNTYSVELDVEGYERWSQGLGFIEDELPDIEAWERELLISGTCDECWKKFFPPVNIEDCE